MTRMYICSRASECGVDSDECFHAAPHEKLAGLSPVSCWAECRRIREASCHPISTPNHPIMETNGPANILTLCRDIREGRRPYGPDVLDMIERNAARTIAYMGAWQKQPGTNWHDVKDGEQKAITPKG